MVLLIGIEYPFLAGCLEDEPKYSIPQSVAFITAMRITRIHLNWRSIDVETAVAVFGSNKTAGFLEQLNYVIYLVSRVKYECARFLHSRGFEAHNLSSGLTSRYRK
jgi:hypothetical protein